MPKAAIEYSKVLSEIIVLKELMYLDSRRAIQIMESHGVIEVTHQGSPVWLEGIKGDIAEVSYIKTGKPADVPLNELVEGNKSF